jgi:hypothetical protein
LLATGTGFGGKKSGNEVGWWDADQDFFYNSYAKKYMLSTGGYSKIMGKMAVMHGGEIIGNLTFDLASNYGPRAGSRYSIFNFFGFFLL